MDNSQFFEIRQSANTILSLLEAPVLSGGAVANELVLSKAAQAFNGQSCDRIFFYNPDAIALWIYEKYRPFFTPIEETGALRIPIHTVFPPVTPVCFASFYSGLEPKEHGILKYEKPVLTVDTVFDILPKSGKKTAIVCTAGDSIAKIFLNRDVDYFIYKTKEECNKKALELIRADEYSFIELYNGDYDHWMHRFGPEGRKPLKSLRENVATYLEMKSAIEENWKSHNTVMAFAPDHGCHKVYGFFGSHGINEPCDMETSHFYNFLPTKKGR